MLAVIGVYVVYADEQMADMSSSRHIASTISTGTSDNVAVVDKLRKDLHLISRFAPVPIKQVSCDESSEG
jgi:hypothetical protein